MSIPDRDLIAQLLGVLEPGDAAWLETRTGLDERLRAASLAAAAGIPGASPLPPLRASPGAAALLDAAPPMRPGERLVVPLAWEAPLDRARCVVWREVGGHLERIFPSGPSWAPLSRFRQQDGEPVADIVLAGPPGRQRFEVVLLHEDLAEEPWEEDDPRWGRVREFWLAGLLAGCTVEVTVEPGPT